MPRAIPNQDIQITEDFLPKTKFCWHSSPSRSSKERMEAPGATDYDVREAFDALIATWRTLQAGIYYEARPTNTFAAAIASHVHERIDEVREKEAEARGVSSHPGFGHSRRPGFSAEARILTEQRPQTEPRVPRFSAGILLALTGTRFRNRGGPPTSHWSFSDGADRHRGVRARIERGIGQ